LGEYPRSGTKVRLLLLGGVCEGDELLCRGQGRAAKLRGETLKVDEEGKGEDAEVRNRG